MMRRLALLVATLFLVAPPFAHAAVDVDLSVSAGDISFSGSLVSGDKIRLYSKIHNLGEEDVDGYVSFYQGDALIGDSQIISVRADGDDEDVYVDFVVPNGSFNIRADIRGTDPKDQNPANDSALSKLFTPITDEDRDTIEDSKDNCPTTKNKDQKDTDKDGRGDACDDDDDNDGLTDEVERELGSSSTNRDTDGDGVGDKQDAYPTDATKSVAPPPPAPVPVPAPSLPPAEVKGVTVAAPKPAPTKLAQAPAAATTSVPPTTSAADTAEAPAVTSEPKPGDSFQLSSNAAFRYERVSWNTYTFEALAPIVAGERVAWDFGDGITSNRREVTHVYNQTGDFKVSLAITYPDGTASTGDTVVSVPFFTLENRIVAGIVGLLALALLAGLIWLLRLFLFARKRKEEDEDDAEDESPSSARRSVTVRDEDESA